MYFLYAGVCGTSFMCLSTQRYCHNDTSKHVKRTSINIKPNQTKYMVHSFCQSNKFLSQKLVSVLEIDFCHRIRFLSQIKSFCHSSVAQYQHTEISHIANGFQLELCHIAHPPKVQGYGGSLKFSYSQPCDSTLNFNM